jgi:hypothetical protein
LIRGRSRFSLFGAALVATVALAAGRVDAVEFTIVNLDSNGEGFNDNTPATPVGGNTGTTVGEQRLIAFQYAADLWGARIDSDIDIVVNASFDPLSCNTFGAVLGQAGPVTARRDFSGAPVSSTWYAASLANAIAGTDFTPGQADINAFFNSELGQLDCLAGVFFYYGLDGNEGGNIDFVTVLAHELGHGLGFLSLVNGLTGQLNGGFFDAYSNFLEDHSNQQELYPEMSDSERQAAAIDGTQTTSDLHWTGDLAIAQGAELTNGRHPSGHIEMYAPNPFESGSSVSHWAKSLTPNALMEPSFTSALHNLELDLALLEDTGYPNVFRCGDANRDGSQTATDALIALNTAVGLGSCIETSCDVNSTGNTTSTDALIILNVSVGLDVPVSCGLA